MFQIQKAPITKKAGGHSKASGTERKSSYGSGTGTAFANMSIHYHSGHQPPVVQMIRKRVKGAAGTFTEEDIYYDKSDGKYYKGMTQAGHGEVIIQNGEYQKYQKYQQYDINSQRKDQMSKTTILAQAKQGGVDKYAGKIEPTAGHAGEGNAAEADIVATADIFTAGYDMTNPPKVVRLYAEGDMKHAVSLARAFEKPGKYSLYEGLGADTVINNADNTTPEVLVKATEFDNLNGLAERYGRTIYVDTLRRFIGAKRLEASFGGFTGDMTRKHQNQNQNQNHAVRLYDIIQATFFWIPDATNDENLNKLKKFMLNKKEKLKPGGKIRIILANKNSGEKNDNDRNNYRWVADQLENDQQLGANFVVYKKIFKRRNNQNKKVKQTYADKLTALGMNEAGFVHTRTQGLIEVQSYGDLMIEATKKPTVNT